MLNFMTATQYNINDTDEHDGKMMSLSFSSREYIIGPKSYLMRLYAKREYKEAGLSRRQRRINRNHKVFLEDMEANGCST